MIKSKLNDDFFTFQKPEYCYVMGWLLSDGSLYNRKLCLGIVKNDADNIYNILCSVGNWNIFNEKAYKNNQAVTRFHITSKKISETLISIDYTLKNKKIPHKIINNIPEKYIHLFIRGIIDGDGCWYINCKHSCYQCSIASNKDYDWSCLVNIFNKQKINTYIKRQKVKYIYQNKIKNGGQSYLITTSLKPTVKLGNWIYKDNLHLKLDRKYEKFILIKKQHYKSFGINNNDSSISF